MVKSGFSGVLSGRIAKRRPLTSTSFTPHVSCSIRSMVCRASWISISSAARVSMRLWMWLARVVAQFRSGHGPISVLFECYRIRTDSGMPRALSS